MHTVSAQEVNGFLIIAVPAEVAAELQLSAAGRKTTGVVLCHQPRALDLAARKARKLERVPDEVLEEVLHKLPVLFE